MKNLFRGFGSKSTTSNEENVAIDLDEQELEAVNGACGDDYHYDDDDDCDYDDDNYCHRHHHHRHHRY